MCYITDSAQEHIRLIDSENENVCHECNEEMNYKYFQNSNVCIYCSDELEGTVIIDNGWVKIKVGEIIFEISNRDYLLKPNEIVLGRILQNKFSIFQK